LSFKSNNKIKVKIKIENHFVRVKFVTKDNRKKRVQSSASRVGF